QAGASTRRRDLRGGEPRHRGARICGHRSEEGSGRRRAQRQDPGAAHDRCIARAQRPDPGGRGRRAGDRRRARAYPFQSRTRGHPAHGMEASPMIGRLRGILVSKQPPWLLVEVGGVGYELEAPMSTIYDLPQTGKEVTLLTHYAVKEDSVALYGFLHESERTSFRNL